MSLVLDYLVGTTKGIVNELLLMLFEEDPGSTEGILELSHQGNRGVIHGGNCVVTH